MAETSGQQGAVADQFKLEWFGQLINCLSYLRINGLEAGSMNEQNAKDNGSGK